MIKKNITLKQDQSNFKTQDPLLFDYLTRQELAAPQAPESGKHADEKRPDRQMIVQQIFKQNLIMMQNTDCLKLGNSSILKVKEEIVRHHPIE